MRLKLRTLTKQLLNLLLKLAPFFHADRSYIFEFSDHLEFADNTYEWCAEGIQPVIQDLKNIPMTGYDTWIDSWFSGQAIPIEDVFELPESTARNARYSSRKAFGH